MKHPRAFFVVLASLLCAPGLPAALLPQGEKGYASGEGVVPNEMCADHVLCAALLIYLAGGRPSAFLNIVMKAVTDS